MITTVTAARPVRVAPTASATVTGFERYVFGDELGRGGLGVVRLAEDLSLRRELAIKTLLRPDATATAAFVEEAQITGQLEHPNIVPVHELGFDPDGRPYLAMKRVQGSTLRDEINRYHDTVWDSDADAEAELRRLLEIMTRVCDAVGYAHSRGVIHRDLKPDNVMTGEFGEVLVMDWGLARPHAPNTGGSSQPHAHAIASQSSRRKVTSDRRATTPDLTMDGDVFGTPSYMSPEQAGGWVDQIGPATDIYALGAMLYSVLTAHAPFDTGDTMHILIDVQAGRLIPPSHRETFRPVPRELEAATLRAMALDPAQRYASAAELKADIGRYLAGHALAAAEYTSWQLVSKWARRHKVALAGALSTAAAIIIGLAAVIIMRDQARSAELEKQRSSAMAFAAAAHEELDAAKAVAFNAASPQDYYSAWLPLMLNLGRAIQTHPEPPAEWRSELAGYCQAVQDAAVSIGDWGMALHVAGSAEAWGAVDADDFRQRHQQVESARADRIAADSQRLDMVLDRLRNAEASQQPAGGYYRTHDPSSITPYPADDLARELVRHARHDTEPLCRIVLQRLDDTTDRQDSTTFLQRQFLIRLLGGLLDIHTAVNGRTALDRCVDALRTTVDPARTDEVAQWIATACSLDSATGHPVSERLGRPLLDEIDALTTRAKSMVLYSSMVANRLPLLAAMGQLPEFEGNLLEVNFQLARIEHWLDASVLSGRDYTRLLLDLLTGRGADQRQLTPFQAMFVIDQIGRRGDGEPVDVGRPDYNARTILHRMLADIEGMLTTRRSNDPQFAFLRGVMLINALARLGATEAAPLVFHIIRESGKHSRLLRFCHKALQQLEWPDSAVPATADQWMERALQRRMHGDFETGIAELSRAVELFPDEPVLIAERAGLRLLSGQVDAAIADADQLIALDANEPAGWIARGTCHDSRGDAPAALADYTRAIELDPRAYIAVLHRGWVNLQLRHYRDALADFNHALELYPLMVSAWHGRGLVFARLGRHREAISDFMHAEGIDPSFTPALTSRAESHASLGEYPDSLVDSLRALAVDPASVDAWCARGLAQAHINRMDDGLAAYDRAVSLDPANTSALQGRAVLLWNMQRMDEADADFRRAIELDSTLWEAWLGRANVAAESGKRVLAAACYDRALAEAPPNAHRAIRETRRQLLGD
ncbi:MAG: tetratricopeptide repeat protein [Planctomycetota bacterium]